MSLLHFVRDMWRAAQVGLRPRHNPQGQPMHTTRKTTTILASLACTLLLTLGTTTDAQARAVRIDPKDDTYTGRVLVQKVRHVEGRWFYVELTNGAKWMMTRCAYWNSLDCWFDAKKRTAAAPYKTRPYVDISGRTIYLARNGTVRR